MLHKEAELPAFDPATWDFRITGLVEQPLTLSWAEFEALPRVELSADFHCVTHWSMFGSRWRGVRVRDLLARARVRPEARFTMWSSSSGYTTNVSLADCLREDVLLVDAWNGAPLEPRHGGPVRSLIPHLYAWKSTKWVRGVELMAADRPGYWEERGYHMYADPWQEQRFGR